MQRKENLKMSSCVSQYTYIHTVDLPLDVILINIKKITLIAILPYITIDIMDKTPFFIRPYHVREEDKRILDKQMKRLCYLGILKEGFSAYSSPVMLISRKMTQDKRVVPDFRHLNTRMTKNNLAYPLIKDTFSMLGKFICDVLSVLDLKGTS